MSNPYKSQRERAAYEAGLSAAPPQRRNEDETAAPQPLTRADVSRMSPGEINRRWSEVTTALRAGLPTGGDDDDR